MTWAGDGMGREMTSRRVAVDSGHGQGDVMTLGVLWKELLYIGDTIAVGHWWGCPWQYLWFPQSQQSHRWCQQAQRSARAAGRSGPHAYSAQLVCRGTEQHGDVVPAHGAGAQGTTCRHSPHQLQQHQVGLRGAADDAYNGDGLQVGVGGAGVLEQRPQVHLIA